MSSCTNLFKSLPYRVRISNAWGGGEYTHSNTYFCFFFIYSYYCNAVFILYYIFCQRQSCYPCCSHDWSTTWTELGPETWTPTASRRPRWSGYVLGWSSSSTTWDFWNRTGNIINDYSSDGCSDKNKCVRHRPVHGDVSVHTGIQGGAWPPQVANQHS